MPCRRPSLQQRWLPVPTAPRSKIWRVAHWSHFVTTSRTTCLSIVMFTQLDWHWNRFLNECGEAVSESLRLTFRQFYIVSQTLIISLILHLRRCHPFLCGPCGSGSPVWWRCRRLPDRLFQHWKQFQFQPRYFRRCQCTHPIPLKAPDHCRRSDPICRSGWHYQLSRRSSTGLQTRAPERNCPCSRWIDPWTPGPSRSDLRPHGRCRKILPYRSRRTVGGPHHCSGGPPWSNDPASPLRLDPLHIWHPSVPRGHAQRCWIPRNSKQHWWVHPMLICVCFCISMRCVGEQLSPLPLGSGVDVGEMRLQSDFALARDSRTACTWQGFVNEQELMSSSFKRVMAKLAVIGQNETNLITCSSVIPVPVPASGKPATSVTQVFGLWRMLTEIQVPCHEDVCRHRASLCLSLPQSRHRPWSNGDLYPVRPLVMKTFSHTHVVHIATVPTARRRAERDFASYLI